MHLATFRIAGTDGYEALTRETAVDVELWCNDHCDLLHLEGPGAPETLEHVRETVGVRDTLEGSDEVVVITADCLREHQAGLVEDYVRATGCLLLPPLRYNDGAKVVRVLALDPASLSTCFQDMLADGLDVTVESKREVDSVGSETPVISGQDAVSDLTRRQRTTLRHAIDAGYYELPRRVTTAELASRMGLARRTVEEHLRRAEKKVIAGTTEFL